MGIDLIYAEKRNQHGAQRNQRSPLEAMQQVIKHRRDKIHDCHAAQTEHQQPLRADAPHAD